MIDSLCAAVGALGVGCLAASIRVWSLSRAWYRAAPAPEPFSLRDLRLIFGRRFDRQDRKLSRLERRLEELERGRWTAVVPHVYDDAAGVGVLDEPTIHKLREVFDGA